MQNLKNLSLNNETLKELFSKTSECAYIDINRIAIEKLSYLICIFSILFSIYLFYRIYKMKKISIAYFIIIFYYFFIILFSSYLIYGITYNYILYNIIHSYGILSLLFLFLWWLLKYEKTKRLFEKDK